VALGWSQQDLADKAEVGVASVSRLEALSESAEPMDSLRPSTITRIVTVLEAHGVEFLFFEDGTRLGVTFPRKR
jgi:predicted transcriptional regulator